MRMITLPPCAPILIESTRAIGYTLESAIADIIDNSVSASASFVDIFFFPTEDSFIAILDNGKGMNEDEINMAMRYGSFSPNEKRVASDLGRFGLGLKTASLSQCRTLTVISKQKNRIEARQWDIDYVIETNDWSLKILDSADEINSIPRIENLMCLPSGTLVVWQNLDRLRIGELDFDKSMGKRMDAVRNHLSLVFHRYISGEIGLSKVQIRMNNAPIEAIDPFLSKRNTQIMANEYIYIGESQIVVRPYILPHISDMTHDEIDALGGKEGLRKSQGFYIYRNKRLLVWGTWFRMMRQGELSKLARIQVDIPNELDRLWTLDIKKSTATPPEIVRINLAAIIEKMASQSKRTWEYRGKKEMHESIVHVWQRFKGRQGGSYYAVNREHPVVEAFDGSSPEIKRNVENLLKMIETSLPLNSLYLDLNSDKPIENDIDASLEEIETLLKGLLSQVTTSAGKNKLLDRLIISEPFVNYPKLIEKYKAGGDMSGDN